MVGSGQMRIPFQRRPRAISKREENIAPIAARRISRESEDGVLTRISSRGPRGSNLRRIGGRVVDITPEQATRLEISQAQMRAAVAAVRKIDSRWRPTPQAYQTVEREIQANMANRLEAELRLY